MKKITGTPSLLESEGSRWQVAPKEKSVTLDETNAATESLWDHLGTQYKVGSGDWDDIFLRGTFLEERSQVLEIVYPPILTPKLIAHIQAWLTGNHANWRVNIPTFLGHRAAVVVYPQIIRHGDFSGTCEEPILQEVVKRMMALKQFAFTQERASEDGWKP